MTSAERNAQYFQNNVDQAREMVEYAQSRLVRAQKSYKEALTQAGSEQERNQVSALMVQLHTVQESMAAFLAFQAQV